MSLFSIWSSFGLRENPYSQATLAADETGDELLVGRDAEVAQLQAAIGSGGTHPTLEGPVGAGKSSLLAVTGYRMTQACLTARAGELYFPAAEFFQVKADLDEFEHDVFMSLAQALVKNVGMFSTVGLEEPRVGELGKWLNSPEYTSWEASGGGFGFSGGAGAGESANDGGGFLRSGLPTLVREELARCLPPGTGGIICVLDNLELLRSTGQARETLDELRDRLFNIPQLRWILCGSRGIVSRARSERLSGIFQAPMLLKPLDHPSALGAIERRITLYGMDGAAAPVTPAGFDFLYSALNSNLRDSLSHAQEFAQWLYSDTVQQDKDVPSAEDREAFLQAWLAERAQEAHGDADGVQPRHWQFFMDLAASGGKAPSSNFAYFGFSTQQQFTAAVTSLVQANLMVRESDPDDGTRTLNAMTSLGWLVHFFRSKFSLPEPVDHSNAAEPVAPDVPLPFPGD